MLEILFWSFAVAAIYSYVLYPAILSLLPKRTDRSGAASAYDLVPVTLIIACRNEAARLRQKLDNALAIDYPGLEIIVASDASDDGSDAIVNQYAHRGVRLVRSDARLGKEHAQGLAVAAAQGAIVVFSDAGTSLPAESIRKVVDNFRDPRVGAVSSEDTFVSADGSVVGEGAYVRYEMWLRRLESSVSSLVGLSGSFFAARRQVLSDWNDTIPSDFGTAIQTVRAGLVAVSDPQVRGIYRDVTDPSREYSRKVRTALRGMAGLAEAADVLNPFRCGVFAFQLWSHKIMRWLVPWFLLGTLLTSAGLSGRSAFFAAVFGLQLAVYFAVCVTHLSAALRRVMPLRIIYFFVQVNIALAHAGLRFLRGDRIRAWDPSVR